MNFFSSWHHHQGTTPSIPHSEVVTDDDDNTSTASSSSSLVSIDGSASCTTDFDTVRAMCQQEMYTYKKCDPLRQCIERNQSHQHPNYSTENDIDEICRDKMCEWSYQIVDFCKFHRESVDIAMNYLDRFLLTRFGQTALHDRNEYQLLAMTCLYSAIKIHERQALSPTVVSQLSRGVYSAQQIAETEVIILHALQWQLHPPTAFSFVRELITALPTQYFPDSIKKSIFDITQKETEFAVSDYRFIEIPMSTIAYCSVMNALHCCGNTLPNDAICDISTLMASAIGLTDPSSSYIIDVERMLSTVCPTCNVLKASSVLTHSSDDLLDYSTSTIDVEEVVELKRYRHCDDGNVKERTKQLRRTSTFDISPRSSTNVAASAITASTIDTSAHSFV